jgi:orotate phosphoribosyltransferase
MKKYLYAALLMSVGLGFTSVTIAQQFTLTGKVFDKATGKTLAGAIVVGVAVIVERGAAPKVEAAGLEYRAAFQLADLGL